MTRSSGLVLAFLCGIIWLLASLLLVPQRHGSTMTIDARMYVAMAEGRPEDTSMPFRARAMPSLLAAWTGTGADGLAVSSYALCLAIVAALYFVGLDAGADPLASAFGTVVAWPLVARVHESPWMTDYLAILVSALILLSSRRRWPWPVTLGLAALSGSVRELSATLYVGTRDRRRAFAGAATCVLVYVTIWLVRWQPGDVAPDPDVSVAAWVMGAVDSLGFAWPLVLAGGVAWWRRDPAIRLTLAAFAAVSLAQSFAGTPSRLMAMFALAPAAGSVASFAASMPAERRRVVIACVTCAALMSCVAMIHAVASGRGFAAWRLAALAVSIGATAYATTGVSRRAAEAVAS